MKALGRSCIYKLCTDHGSVPARPVRIAHLFTAALFLGTVAAANALTINTTNAVDIAAFQAGATVEGFDSGLTGLIITSYTPVNVPVGSQFFSRNISDPNVPSFNSGGASFANPASNPGTPVGVFNPEGGIAANVRSQTNVIGPLGIDTGAGPGQGFAPGAFMEVRFVNPVSKVGFQVTSGSLTLILKDINNTNLAGVDSSVNGTIGNFIGISRGSADIGGATILASSGASFTLDDFTFARGTTTSSVPDGDSVWNLAMAAALVWWAGRKLKFKAV